MNQKEKGLGSKMAIAGAVLDPVALGCYPVVGLDAGNAYLKVCYGGDVFSIPSTIKVLSEYEEVFVPADNRSVLVEYEGSRYLIGELAELLGGEPIYRRGKAQSLPILFMAGLSIAGSLAPTIERLRVLVPDGRKSQIELQWQGVAEKIQSISRCVVNGQVLQPQVRAVEFVHEGVPAFTWASSQGSFDQVGQPMVGILDVGGGEATLQVFDLRSGQINWTKNLTLPGLSDLASRISRHLKPKTQFTPDTAIILRMIAKQAYVYERAGNSIDFLEEYNTCLKDWQRSILQAVSEANVLDADLGLVLIVGGGAAYCDGIQRATANRFFAPTYEVSLQNLNALALSRG